MGFSALIHRLRARMGRYEPIIFFIAGFLFDVLTLKRIDDWLKLGFQILFLFILALFLIYQAKREPGLEPEPGLKLPPSGASETKENWFIRKVWPYQIEIVHFLFGSMLSAFVIFYFRSTTLSRSLIFFALLLVLMLINEFPRFRGQGLRLKLALFSFCLVSFLIYFLPVLWGSISVVLFLISVALSSLISFEIGRRMQKYRPQRRLLWPSAVVYLLILAAYFTKAIPPVPVSMTFGGIYHKVEKQKGEFRLYSLKPWYDFWSHGDTDYRARPGDAIFCFVRIYAPARFNHHVFLHWSLLDPRTQKYETQDRIEMAISGGREEGFRGYSYKSNYQAGAWRVDIESEDSRVFGTIRFQVTPDNSEEDRIWMVDRG